MSRLSQSEVNALDSYHRDAPPDDLRFRAGYQRLADAIGDEAAYSVAPQMLRGRGDLVREIDAGQVVAHDEDEEREAWDRDNVQDPFDGGRLS